MAQKEAFLQKYVYIVFDYYHFTNSELLVTVVTSSVVDP
jgi:hypothetical protein